MWPDTPENYKTPLALNIILWLIIIALSLLAVGFYDARALNMIANK
jgi:hypothetical protein